nr:MAG: nucleocapsid protein [Tibet bird virus 1]
MASTTKTFQDALTSLQIADPEASATYKVSGTAPNQLLNHTIKKDYIILGITPEDFIKKHGSVQFDFEKLTKEFKKICYDYLDPLMQGVASRAVEFCSKMLYEVGPESRQVKKKDGDKVWKFDFIYKDNATGKVIIKVAFVCTFKDDKNEYIPEATTDKIVLTVKHASLLAINTLELINQIALTMTPEVVLLTPLAGAVYSKDDLAALATELQIGKIDAINIINASCQSGGHFLKNSRMHCAVVAAIVATRNVKDPKMQNSIIGKTIKQYLSMKKKWDSPKFEVYATFANGGVPTNLSPDNLVKLFDDIKRILPTKAALAAKQTLTTTTVQAPGPVTTGSPKLQPKTSKSPPPKP